MTDLSSIDAKSIAGIIGKKLSEHNIEAILVGGAVVTIYSKNRYMSYDLDYVIYDDLSRVKKALAEIGFERKGKYFVHPNCPFFIDLVTPPVATGGKPVTQFEHFTTSFGTITLLKPTDCVKDRLASYFHWNDNHALEQAISVCHEQKVDLKEIELWAKDEGFNEQFQIIRKRLY